MKMGVTCKIRINNRTAALGQQPSFISLSPGRLESARSGPPVPYQSKSWFQPEVHGLNGRLVRAGERRWSSVIWPLSDRTAQSDGFNMNPVEYSPYIDTILQMAGDWKSIVWIPDPSNLLLSKHSKNRQNHRHPYQASSHFQIPNC